jgi:hypothetical protein
MTQPSKNSVTIPYIDPAPVRSSLFDFLEFKVEYKFLIGTSVDSDTFIDVIETVNTWIIENIVYQDAVRNIGDSYFDANLAYVVLDYSYSFRNESDATAFRLRWGDSLIIE